MQSKKWRQKRIEQRYLNLLRPLRMPSGERTSNDSANDSSSPMAAASPYSSSLCTLQSTSARQTRNGTLRAHTRPNKKRVTVPWLCPSWLRPACRWDLGDSHCEDPAERRAAKSLAGITNGHYVYKFQMHFLGNKITNGTLSPLWGFFFLEFAIFRW